MKLRIGRVRLNLFKESIVADDKQIGYYLDVRQYQGESEADYPYFIGDDVNPQQVEAEVQKVIAEIENGERLTGSCGEFIVQSYYQSENGSVPDTAHRVHRLG